MLAQSYLTVALVELSIKTQAPDNLKYQTEAVVAYKDLFAATRAGVKLLTPESSPEVWVVTQNNFCRTLIVKGLLTPGDGGQQDLDSAIAASKAVLEAGGPGAKIYTPETFPSGWAWAQLNLGTALVNLSFRGSPADKPGRARAAIEAATTVLGANKAGARIFTPEAFANEWLSAQSLLANGYSELDSWAQTRDVYVEILRRFPDNTLIYRSLRIVYVEKLFAFDQVFDLDQQWLARHPNDLDAELGFVASHFRTGRFAEFERRIGSLLNLPGLSADNAVVLHVIEIANLIALDRQNEVPGKLDALIKEVEGQQASFKLAWAFEGTKNYIEHQEGLKPQSVWLRQFLDAFQSKDRDALLEALRKARARWKLSADSTTRLNGTTEH
jgi:hypothetical protein